MCAIIKGTQLFRVCPAECLIYCLHAGVEQSDVLHKCNFFTFLVVLIFFYPVAFDRQMQFLFSAYATHGSLESRPSVLSRWAEVLPNGTVGPLPQVFWFLPNGVQSLHVDCYQLKVWWGIWCCCF